MKAAEALIAWTPTDERHPTAGQVKVGRLLTGADHRDWTHPFSMTGGAANVHWRELAGCEAAAAVFVEFTTLVVRDGLNPNDVHMAFLAIEEYASRVSPELASGA